MFGSYLSVICQCIGGDQNSTGKVKSLVKECCGDSQSGLPAATDRLGMNNSYLGGLFKKETDENFIDYLVNVRVGKAGYLLKTTRLKDSKISAMTGSEDERYSGKVFRKKCGVTLRQYRESIT